MWRRVVWWIFPKSTRERFAINVSEVITFSVSIFRVKYLRRYYCFRGTYCLHLQAKMYRHYSVGYRRYATIARTNMRCLETTVKHVKDIWGIARQPPITI
jgi:hypothetical protein